MLYTDHALAKVRAYIKMGYSKYRLASDAGVPDGSIRECDSADWNPTALTLLKIEKAIPKKFKLSPEEKLKLKESRSN